MTLHILKLCVGCESVEDLADWQKDRARELPGGLPRHVTRMWPKQAQAVLDGGSIYWVIKGVIQCRQRIARLDEVTGSDGIRRCAIVLDPVLVRTAPALKRPFQGWRYLDPKDAPPDLTPGRESDDDLPPDLSAKLAEIGVL